MKNFMKKAGAVAMSLALFVGNTPDADACTGFLVGKKASVDGSAFISYNSDDYGMYGFLQFLPAAKHPKGAMRRIVDGDTFKYLCDIPEARETYSVMGHICIGCTVGSVHSVVWVHHHIL